MERLCLESDLHSIMIDKRDVGYETYRVYELIRRN
jgi:hypothetical protein